MRTFLNFTLAILLLIAFIGSTAFFISISNGLKLERVEQPADTERADSSEEATAS